MRADPFKKVTGSPAALGAELGLSAAAQALLTPEATAREFLAALLAGGHYADATRFLARALPRREAVWWACLCARDTLPAPPPEPLVRALAAAEAWVFEPSEKNRRAARAEADVAKFASPASWAALAAFWSGGSLAPANLPAVMPGEALTATAVATAIMLATADPREAEARYRRFLDYGIDIADGGSGRPRAPR